MDGIPAYINQYEYIISNGGDPTQGRWAHDGHWNEQGHRWAAQALLEYFQTQPDICR